MGRFATREDEVDDLFRLGVFADLYWVVRQGEDLPRPGVAPEDPAVTRIRSALLAGVSAEAACEILHKAFPRRRASRKAYSAGSRPGCSSWS
jgi:hypothetical protein